MMPDNFSLMLLAMLVIVIVVLIFQFASARHQKQTIVQLQEQIEARAKQQYESWRVKEIEAIRQEQRDIAMREANVSLESWKVQSESYFRSDDIEAADRVRDEIYEAILRVIMMPTIGHLREDLADDKTLRFWPIRHYLIIYRPDSQPLEIVRVLSGRRDLKVLLQS